MSNPTPNALPEPLPVLLSASAPDELAGTSETLRVCDYVVAIVEALFDRGLHLVFGGHPTITPLVHRAARTRGADKPPIDLFQPERFRAHHPDGPVYLVGGAGGETARLVAETQGRDWERNGLHGEAREVLHASRDGQIVAVIIARDLERYRGSPHA